MVVEYKRCPTSGISDELAKLIEEAYAATSYEQHFNIGLSGGSLPGLLMTALENVTLPDWKKFRFMFCDERCVSFESEDSTFGVYRKLIGEIHQKSGPEVVPISLSQFITIDPSLKNSKCADDYQSKVRRHFQLSNAASSPPKFDILFLGVGPDGHTCSLFPNHKLLKETSKWVAFIGDSPKPPPERVTFTYQVLNNSKLCVFVATGKGKAEIIKEILVDKKPYPARLVEPTHGKTIWLVDDEAGSLLP
ncbi:6-phosphogluconolactonase, partial [Fragariocoptes setiger]